MSPVQKTDSSSAGQPPACSSECFCVRLRGEAGPRYLALRVYEFTVLLIQYWLPNLKWFHDLSGIKQSGCVNNGNICNNLHYLRYSTRGGVFTALYKTYKGFKQGMFHLISDSWPQPYATLHVWRTDCSVGTYESQWDIPCKEGFTVWLG